MKTTLSLSKPLVPDMTTQARASFRHLLVELAKKSAEFRNQERVSRITTSYFNTLWKHNHMA
jgi:hypothetical protein